MFGLLAGTKKTVRNNRVSRKLGSTVSIVYILKLCLFIFTDVEIHFVLHIAMLKLTAVHMIIRVKAEK